MNKPFTGDFPLTQGFGVNPEDYARFGLAGHNGLDFGLPLGTELISAIAGKVIEVADDPTGYGLYIKIENDTEGFLVAHLQSQDVQVGQEVDQGQHIGFSDNTGNSTGPHLHFGYFRKPRDRSNGFAGYIDPLPYFGSDIIHPMIPDYLKNLLQENNLSLDNESQIREWFEKARRYDGLKTDFDNSQLTNDQQAKMIVGLQNDLKSLSTSPVDGPKTVDLSIKDILVLLIQKIFK